MFFKVSDDFMEHLESFSSSGQDFDAKLMFTSFTLDAIASAGLGIEARSFKDPDSILRQKVSQLSCGGFSYMAQWSGRGTVFLPVQYCSFINKRPVLERYNADPIPIHYTL